MWCSCGVQNETDLPFYLKVDNLLDGYRVFLSNHVKLWKKEFSKENFLKMMLSSNPDVETDDNQRFLETGLHILRNPKLVNKKKFTETADGNIQVELLWLGPIVWNVCFELTVCGAEDFFYYVTRPLLLVIKDQIQSESTLRTQLSKKDQEIQGFLEMLPENSPLMRCLRTKKFNDQEHRKNHNAVLKLFGTDPEEVVCPPQVIHYKRSLPVLKIEDGCDIIDELNSHENHSGPSTTIKLKSTNNANLEANNVKIKPKQCKSESNSATVNGANNKDTKDNNSLHPSIGQSIVKSEPESVTSKAENMNLAVDHDETPNTSLRAISPEMRLSQRLQASTPKKRRKNLNY